MFEKQLISEAEINPSGNIKASLGGNNSLEIEWIPRSADCLKFSSGVWIRVFESKQRQQLPLTDSYLAIPQKCLKRRSNASFSIVLPAASSPPPRENTCFFELKDILIKCLAYTVEVIPNYQSLKGSPMLTEVVIPPTVEYITSCTLEKSLEKLAPTYSILLVEWPSHDFGIVN